MSTRVTRRGAASEPRVVLVIIRPKALRSDAPGFMTVRAPRTGTAPDRAFGTADWAGGTSMRAHHVYKKRGPRSTLAEAKKGPPAWSRREGRTSSRSSRRLTARGTERHDPLGAHSTDIPARRTANNSHTSDHGRNALNNPLRCAACAGRGNGAGPSSRDTEGR